MANGMDSDDILAAYESIRSDKEPNNWLLLSDDPSARNKLMLAGQGSGGLAELTPLLDDQSVQYAYLRQEYANDKESTRVKFALIVWIGRDIKPLRRGRVFSEAAEVKRVLSHYSIQVDASTKGDLIEDDIITRLRKAGGADYNGGRG
jgi:hypothetical protein